MTTVSNGVNVQALLDAREVLKGAPEAAQFTWRASSRWQNGVHNTISVQNYFGLGDRGVIEPGRRADLVLIDSDPLHDITATRSIRRIWCGGIEVTPL